MIITRARSMRAVAAGAIGVLIAGAGLTAASATTESKVWVCKYVTTPGEAEVLKKGNDGLVWVSQNTLKDQEVTVGASFPDAQGRSLVVQIGGERPDPSVCPGYVAPTVLAPTVFTTDPCGVNNATLAGVADERLSWSKVKTLSDGTLQITAKLKDDSAYTFGQNQFVFTFKDSGVACIETPATQFVTIIWKMNPVGAPPVFTPAQTIVDHKVTSTPKLGAFDNLLVGKCVGFQVDVYKYTVAADIAAVDHLVSVGILTGPGNPPEPLIAGGLGTAWKFYQNSDCARPVAVYPVFPEPAPPTCDADGALPSTPAAGGGIEYAWDEDGKTLRATATDGNFIPEGTATSRIYDESGSATGYQSSNIEGDCYTGQPEGLSGETVSATGQCTAPLDGTYTTVTTTTPWTQEYELNNVTGVWSLGEKVNGEPVVTSIAAPKDSCAVESSAVSASVTDPPVCGPNNDVIDVPPSTDEVTYEDTGWINNERTISATAKPGFILVGPKSWTFYDQVTVCAVEAPTVVPICFPNNDKVSVPEVEGVVYTDTGWVDSKRTIKATAAEGYAPFEDVTWTFTDVPSAGCAPVGAVFSFLSAEELAFTGPSSNTGGLAGLALFLIASGTVLMVRKVRA